MRGSHLIDVFQFVNDLVYNRVVSLHFDFGVGALSFDPVADHAEGVAVKRREAALNQRSPARHLNKQSRSSVFTRAFPLYGAYGTFQKKILDLLFHFIYLPAVITELEVISSI